MRRALLIGIASLLAVALIAPAAQAATQIRQVQAPMPAMVFPLQPTPPPGTLTLDFVFKNTRSNKKRFTPRQLIKIDLSKVPLTCENGHTESYSQLSLTETFETKIEVTKIPSLHPKPGRYAFRFAHSFPTFNGTISGTISKTTGAPKPRPVTSHGHLNIWDLDANPGHSDCTNFPPVGGVWGGGVPVVPV
jgi:hypothetical protein